MDPKFLRALQEAQNQPKLFESTGQAADALKEFLAHPPTQIEVGSRVERNEAGRKLYVVPGENQAAQCVANLNPYISQDGQQVDMRIAVALAQNIVRYYDVDSRFFRVVGKNTVNMYDFKKKTQ